MSKDILDFTVHLSDEARRLEIAELYQLSQDATGEPRFVPRELLGQRLHDASVISGYTAELANRTVIGHGLIERANPQHVAQWTQDTELGKYGLFEISRAFVHPDYARRGVWTELVRHRLEIARMVGTTAVASVDTGRPYLARTLSSMGGTYVGDKPVADGIVSLFRFDKNSSAD